MRYLLVVGFTCNVYRQKPRVRLFFNKKLIDEFNVDHHVKKNYIHPYCGLKHSLEPCASKIYYEYIKNTLPLLRFYSIDVDDRLQKVSIIIDVCNDDSNYTNGFITKSTKLELNVLSLLPVDRRIFEWFRLKSRNQKFTTEKYKWHQKYEINNFFSLLDATLWMGNNGQKFHQVFEQNIGGSGNFHCELTKKYGMLFGKLRYPERAYIYAAKNSLHDILYDKYEKYEN